MPTAAPFPMEANVGDAAINYDAVFMRRALSSLTSVGIVQAQHLAVTQRAAGANMSVDVAAGYAFVQCTSASNAGYYHVFSPGTVNVVVPAAPASGTRTHLIILAVQDKNTDGSQSVYQGLVTIATDSGSGATQPANSIVLAQVSVAAAQTSVLNANIADQRPFAGTANAQPVPRPFTVSGNVGAGSISVAAGTTNDQTVTLIVPAGASKMVNARATWQLQTASTNTTPFTQLNLTVFYVGGTIQSRESHFAANTAADRRSHTIELTNAAGTDGFAVTPGSRAVIMRTQNVAGSGGNAFLVDCVIQGFYV